MQVIFALRFFYINKCKCSLQTGWNRLGGPKQFRLRSFAFQEQLSGLWSLILAFAETFYKPRLMICCQISIFVLQLGEHFSWKQKKGNPWKVLVVTRFTDGYFQLGTVWKHFNLRPDEDTLLSYLPPRYEMRKHISTAKPTHRVIDLSWSIPVIAII